MISLYLAMCCCCSCDWLVSANFFVSFAGRILEMHETDSHSNIIYIYTYVLWHAILLLCAVVCYIFRYILFVSSRYFSNLAAANDYQFGSVCERFEGASPDDTSISVNYSKIRATLHLHLDTRNRLFSHGFTFHMTSRFLELQFSYSHSSQHSFNSNINRKRCVYRKYISVFSFLSPKWILSSRSLLCNKRVSCLCLCVYCFSYDSRSFPHILFTLDWITTTINGMLRKK